jgi:hypothetical protein
MVHMIGCYGMIQIGCYGTDRLLWYDTDHQYDTDDRLLW